MKRVILMALLALIPILGGIHAEATPSIDEPPLEYQQEEVWIKSVLKDNSKSIKALNDLGVLYLKQGQYELAIAEFERAKKIIKHFFVGPAPLATLYTEPETYHRLIEKYEEALLIKKEYARTHNNLGIALMEQNKHELAKFEFEAAKEMQPKSAKAHNNMGILYERMGHLDRAIEEYERALSLESTNEIALYNLGLAYARRGDGEISLQYLGRAQDLLATKDNPVLNEHLESLIKGLRNDSPGTNPRVQQLAGLKEPRIEMLGGTDIPIVSVSVAEGEERGLQEDQKDPPPAPQEPETVICTRAGTEGADKPKVRVLTVLPASSDSLQQNGEGYSQTAEAKNPKSSMVPFDSSSVFHGGSKDSKQQSLLGDWLFLYPK